MRQVRCVSSRRHMRHVRPMRQVKVHVPAEMAHSPKQRKSAQKETSHKAHKIESLPVHFLTRFLAGNFGTSGPAVAGRD